MQKSDQHFAELLLVIILTKDGRFRDSLDSGSDSDSSIPAFPIDLIPIPIPIPKWLKISVIPESIPIPESESPIFDPDQTAPIVWQTRKFNYSLVDWPPFNLLIF